MKSHRRRSLIAASVPALVLATLGVTSMPAHAGEAPAVIRWSTIENASQSFFPVLMRERGIAAKYGLDVQLVRLSQAQAQWTSLRSNEADISTGSVLDLLRQRNSGLRARAIAPFLTFSNPVVTLADKPFNKMSDLRGQTIGTPSATLFDWMILRAASKKAENFDPGRDAKVQNASPGLLIQAVLKGDVAAALQFSDITLPYLATKRFKTITTIPQIIKAAGFDPDSFYLNFNLTDAWAQKHPNLVPNVVAAIEETRQLMMTNDSIWPELAKRTGMTDQSLLKTYIEHTRASMRATMSESKVAPTQEMIDAIIEAVGATAVGIKTVDAAAFDFKSYEAGKAARR